MRGQHGGLSKNMLGLEGWVKDIRLHDISGVGISGWFDVGVTEGRGAFEAPRVSATVCTLPSVCF